MKYFLLVLLSLVAWAQEFEGTGMAGAVGLSGPLKKIVLKDSIPLGTLLETYGYEVWDFTQFKENNENYNRARYCYSTGEVIHDFSLGGLSFGGEFSKSYLVGKCDQTRQTHIGEDLFFSIAYAPQHGTNAKAFGLAFNHGFNMTYFVEQMNKYFYVSSPSTKHLPHQRMFRMHKHILEYISKTQKEIFKNKSQKIIMKLFLAPALLIHKDGKELIGKFDFSNDDMTELQSITESKKPESYKTIILRAFENMKLDSNFYKCSFGDCSELTLDFLKYYKVLKTALEDCHSYNVVAGVSKRFAFDLFKNFPIDISVGYAVTDFDQAYNSSYKPKRDVMGDYIKANVIDHSQACKDIAEKQGKNFGKFLGLWGYGK